MKTLDFGCGRKKYPGSIGIDIAANSAADIKRDLNKFPYPFKKNIFDFIWCHHSLEHVENILKTSGICYKIINYGDVGGQYKESEYKNLPNFLWGTQTKQFIKKISLYVTFCYIL